MAKPLSKTKVVSHIAEKVGTPKKTAALFFEELFKLAVKEAKGAAGKFVIQIKAKTVVRLRPSKAFKDAVLK
jgi:nucleoid DNA-binding protein